MPSQFTGSSMQRVLLASPIISLLADGIEDATKATNKIFPCCRALETALYPRNMGHYLLSTNRHFRDVLRARGYKVTYQEFTGGRDDFNWQEQFAEGLIELNREKR